MKISQILFIILTVCTLTILTGCHKNRVNPHGSATTCPCAEKMHSCCKSGCSKCEGAKKDGASCAKKKSCCEKSGSQSCGKAAEI